MLLTSSWILDILLLLITATAFLYKYMTRKFDYWKERGVYSLKPLPFLGNMAGVSSFKSCIGDWMINIYNSSDEPYFGIFTFDEPRLIIKSPELIKQILVKDFSNFPDRSVAEPQHNKIMANIMFFQRNPEWKESRAKLTSVFTSGKLKSMFPLIETVGKDLEAYLEKNQGVLEAKEVCAKFSTDVIAKCFFGIHSHSFDDEDAAFRKVGRTVFDFTWSNALVQTAYFFRQSWVHTFRLDFIPKKVLDYLDGAISEALRAREGTSVRRNDLVDILQDMKNKSDRSDTEFEAEKLIGPAVQFFVAGFETTSSTISFTLYELCLNKNIQDKLRTEILSSIKKHGGITYEGLMEMKYLDVCVKETLRMYPAVPFLDRTCKDDYRMPGTDFVLEKGLPVYIPLFGLHLDEKYFPEPKRYNPERFFDTNHNCEGLVYMPFGEGPRACIGERFGLMTTKAALAYIIAKFEVEQSRATPIPVIFEPKSFVLQSTVGLPMIFKRIIPTPA